MAEEKSNVGWHAALFIWWGQVWRVVSVNIALFLGITAASKLMPLVHKLIFDLTNRFEGTFLIVVVIFEFFLHMWAIRHSFVDHYPTFTLTAESKMNGRSILGFDRRLKTDQVVAVWWAQTWRMLLIPGAVIAGGFYSTLTRHPGAANYIHLLNNNLTILNLYAAFVLSIWATKQSLGDKYPDFRFTAKPKTFYDKK